MKIISYGLFAALFALLSSVCHAQTSVEEYNRLLPVWGTSWSSGDGRISHYYPSFYTGFVPRSEFPERIHVQTARGNQTRVSVILDEQTVRDYLFDLVARYEFYRTMSTPQQGKDAAIDVAPRRAELLPQMQYFMNVIDSPKFQIKDLVSGTDAEASLSKEFYAQSLQIMEQLNPGRVFRLKIDLSNEFSRWRANLNDLLDGQAPEKVLTKNAEETVIALDTLVWGRVNYIEEPNEAVLKQLHKVAHLAQKGNEEAFTRDAVELFKALTGDKYNTKTLDENGDWVDAIQCTSSQCWLRYPEMTAIYPTGSVKSSTKDRHGNTINDFATPGLWPFLDRSYHDVDHIRKEPYYGFAPKMDFEAAGNGFHNPAVRFAGRQFSKAVKELLNAPMSHDHLWAVKRGGVSSGCLRLASGHIWELRHILPVENEKMKQVYHFGSMATDFDIYDIDGNGQLEVMGVEYQISYDTQGASGLAKRDGKDLNIGLDRKEEFYEDLYGSKGVLSFVSGSFIFSDPSLSFPSHLDFQRKRTKASMTLKGEFPLYEQTYERDKIQFYRPISIEGLQTRGRGGLGDRIVRLMGRVRGCAPSSDARVCGSKAFEDEKKQILNDIY